MELGSLVEPFALEHAHPGLDGRIPGRCGRARVDIIDPEVREERLGRPRRPRVTCIISTRQYGKLCSSLDLETDCVHARFRGEGSRFAAVASDLGLSHEAVRKWEQERRRVARQS